MGEIMPTLSGAEATRGTFVSLHDNFTDEEQDFVFNLFIFIFCVWLKSVCVGRNS